MSRLTKRISPIAWTQAPVCVFTQGSSAQVDLSLSLANTQGKPVVYAVVGSLPTGVSLTGKTLAYNGVGAAASVAVTFTATAGGFTVTSPTSTVSIAPSAANQPPQWSAGTPSGVTVLTTAANDSLVLDLGSYVSDPENDPITITASGLPAWLKFVGKEVRVNGAVTAGQSAAVTFDAVDTVVLPSGELPTLTVSSASGPWTFGQAIKKGAAPQYLTAGPGTQVEVRNRWDDGSVKFCVISAQNKGSVTLAASATDTMLGTPVATSSLSGHTVTIASGANSATWTGADWNSPQRTICSGPVMSSWMYRKTLTSTLSAWLEVRSYSGGNVEIFPWLESTPMFSSVANTGAILHSVTINGVQKFSQTFDVKHHTRIPLVTGSVFSYWTGTDPGITPSHDGAYLRGTKLVPNYSRAVATVSRLNSLIQTYTPNGLAGIGPNMGDSGTSASLLHPSGVAYIASGDVRAYRAVVAFGLSSGSWSAHYRDVANIADGDGHFRCSRYPTTISLPANSGGENGTLAYSHLPSYGFFAYIVTGRYWHFEESAFWLSYGNAVLNNNGARRFGADGIMDTSQGFANRGGAWAIRNLAETACYAPTSHALRAEWLSYVENNAQFYRNKYVDGLAYKNSLTAPDYADWSPANAYVSPQGGFGAYPGSSTYTEATSGGIYLGATWMIAFSVLVWGHLSNLGLEISPTAAANIVAVRNNGYKQPIHRGGDYGWDWRRFSLYSGPFGAPDSGMPNITWYTAAQAYAAYKVIYPSLNDSSLGNNLASHSSDNVSVYSYYGLIEMAGLAMAVEHGVPGALAAWNRITGATNYGLYDAAIADVHEYGILPR